MLRLEISPLTRAPMYWACAQLKPQGERLALHTLALAGYTTYLPRLREVRRSHGRKIEVRPPLFPGYAFVLIELQWHAAPAARFISPQWRDGKDRGC